MIKVGANGRYDEAAPVALGTGAEGADWVPRFVAALLALALLALAAWWIVGRPIAASQQAAQAKVDAKLGTAAGAAAVQAIPQITEAQRQRVEVDVRVQKGTIDVRQAEGAGNDARAVSDAVLRALRVLDGPPDTDGAEQPVLENHQGERVAR